MTLNQYINSINRLNESEHILTVRLQHLVKRMVPELQYDNYDEENVPSVQTNLDQKSGLVNHFGEKLGLMYIREKGFKDDNLCYLDSAELRDEYKTSFTAIDVLDYLYAVLHARKNGEKLLNSDFSQIPISKDTVLFWALVKRGRELRKIHLLESQVVETDVIQFPVAGDNRVMNVKYEDGSVYINHHQYFTHVPAQVWTFSMIAYQPAQKWLYDKIGRKLELDEIHLYQKVIAALMETVRLMNEIDRIVIEVA